MSRLLLIGISIILGGCSMAPQYIQPQAPIENQWPQGAAYAPADDSTSMADQLTWQQFFADAKMQQVLTMALENNRDLRLAALNVERAQALYGIQRAELFPGIDAVGSASRQHLPADLSTSGQETTYSQYEVNLGIAAWELDLFGRIRSLKDQALEAYLASDETRRSAKIALRAEVARVYLTMAADQENLNLAQSTLDTQLQSYSLVEKLLDAGLGTELDLRRAQVPVETARGDVARYTQRVAQDNNALNLLAGTPVPQQLLPANLSSVTAPSNLSAGLSSAVLLQRPDVVAAEHQLKGAYAFIGAARSAFFPRISLTTSFGTASSQLSGLFDAGSGTWNFAPQITMPIFDPRIWAAYRVSKADRQIVQTQYEKTIQTAFREVADTLAVQGTIDQQLSAQQALVKAVKEIYRLALQRYNSGIDSYLGVLDAQRSQFAAEQGLVNLTLAKLTNRVQLYAVLGGGVEQQSASAE
jgi:multidrug efflux system outer membrane protein